MGTTLAASPALAPAPTFHPPFLCKLPRKREQEEVDHEGQGNAQHHAHQQPEQASSSHRLDTFRRVGYAPVVSSGDHLRLEYDLFQDRFQVAHNLLLSFRAQLLERLRQPRKTHLVVHAQECQPPLFSEKYLEPLPFSYTQKGRDFRVRLFHRHSAARAASRFVPCPLAHLWGVAVIG